MGLRDFYYKLEEKYYNFLDKLDSKGIPIYSVIDPIDKVIPSFVLFLLIFGVLIIAVIYAIIMSLGLQTSEMVSVTFADKIGTPIPNSLVTFFLAGEDTSIITDELGAIQFKGKPGEEILFTLTYAGTPYLKSLKLEDDTLTYTVLIDSLNLSKKKLSFSLYTTDNSPLKAVDIYFSCSNSGAAAPDNINNYTSNDVDVDVDGDCGYLLVSTMSEFYTQHDDEQVNDGTSILLSPLQNSGDSRIIINVYDSSNLPLTTVVGDLAIGQYLGPVGTTYSEETNQLVFSNLAPGFYTITVTKEGYSAGTTIISLGETDTKQANVNLTKYDNGANIIIRAFNVSKQVLKDVDVCFYDKNVGIYNKIGCGDPTDDNGLTSYTIPSSTKAYYYTAKKAGYNTASYTLFMPPTPDVLEITLSKSTSDYKLMKAKVLDSFGKPVANAKVMIYETKDEVENIAPYTPAISDVNGIAEFEDYIPDGQYKLFAYKLNYSGFSDKTYFDNTDTLVNFDYTVSMYIPKGIISVSVKDTFGNYVPFPIIKYFDASWNEILPLGETIADAAGQKGVEFRADKKLYFTVEKEGYENYISTAEYIVPDTTTEREVVIEKKKLSQDPKIEFIELTNLEGTQASVLSAGNDYVAKFKITVPVKADGSPFKTMGAYFVAGDKDVVEKDGWHIEKVTYSGLATLSKGRSYSPKDGEEGYNHDIEGINVTGNEIEQGLPFEDTFKWIGMKWDLSEMNVQSGIFFVDVQLKVKDIVRFGEDLPINFKMYVNNKNESDVLTDPLEQNWSDLISPLYAKSRDAFFTVGTTQQTCDDLFCFEINVEDLDEEIIQDLVPDTPYTADIGKTYKLQFKLINNNIKPLSNYRVIISNEQENTFFLTSKIKGVSGDIKPELNSVVLQTENNYNIIYAEDQYMELSKHDMVMGEINFEPRKIGSGSIKFTVIQDKQQYYQKEFLINVNANKELTVEIKPTVLPSYIPIKMDALVKDKETGELIKDAKIYVKDNSELVLFMGKTDDEGKAIIDMPAQKPNVTLKVLIYKPKYKSFEMSYKTSSEFVTIDKDNIDMKVDAKIGLAKEKIIMTNTSDVSVTIDDVFVQGNFAERISLSQINSFLETAYKGKEFDKSLAQAIEVPVTLTQTGMGIQSNEEYDAVLVIKLSAMGGKWEMKVPMHVFLGLGGNVDERSCLAADLIQIKLVSTESKQDKQTLVITNGCTINGNPIGLDSLEAKLEWKTNALGSIQMTKEEYSNRIMPAYYTSLINKVTPNSENTFIVNVEPKSRISGKGEAILHLRALNNTENGPEYLTLDIPMIVDVLNYGECIEFELPNEETDVIATLRDKDTSFKVTNTCDDGIELTFNLKPLDTVIISPEKVNLKGGESKEIKVKPTGSAIGVYTVDVFGKTSGHTNEGIRVGNDALRVLLQPLATDCFYLDNYEFDMSTLQPGEQKWTTLVNKCVNKQAVVQYELEIKAEFDGWDYALSALGGAVGGGAGSMLGGPISSLLGSVGSLGGIGGGRFGMVLLDSTTTTGTTAAATLKVVGAGCGTNTECTTGFCYEKICLEKNKDRISGACNSSTKNDCGSYLVCTAGKCTEPAPSAGSPPPATATTCGNITCNTGETCKDNACVAADATGAIVQAIGGGACEANADCATGFSCVSNKCTAKVETNKGTIPEGGVCEANADCAKGICTGKKCKVVGVTDMVGSGIGAAAGSVGASYLIGSLIGMDPETQGDTAKWSGILGGVGGFFGALGGPTSAMLGGAIGGAIGNLIGIASNDGDVIKKITRTVPTTIEDYIVMNPGSVPIVTAESQKKIIGGMQTGNLAGQVGSVTTVFDSTNKLVKGIGDQAIEMYPIGFEKGTMDNKLENLSLLLAYDRKDLQNLTASESYDQAGWTTQSNSLLNGQTQSGSSAFGMQTGYSGADSYGMPSSTSVIGLQASSDSMSYASATDQGKVEKKDREKLAEALKDEDIIVTEYAPMSMLFTDVKDQEKNYNIPVENCFLANGKTGATGPAAEPKVSFDWSWKTSAKDYLCSNGIYCDSTQLMIEIIDRLKTANSSLSSFKPTVAQNKTLFTETKDITPKYIGVSEVSLKNTGPGTNGVYALKVVLQNNSLADVNGNYVITIIDTQQTKDMNVLNGSFELTSKNGNKSEISIDELVTLYQSTYKIEVQFNNVKQGDLPFNYVTPYTSSAFAYDDSAILGLEKSTDKLIEWGLAAGADVKGISETLNFQAYMMKDGFTKDFLSDFKEYALNQTFMNTKTDVEAILSDLLPDKIEFLPKESALTASGYSLPKAGLYKVEIVIKYTGTNKIWTIFDNKGKVKDTVDSIKVYMEPIQTTNNPLYYLPLDATVGVENGELKREGYGIAFEGDTLWFNVDAGNNPVLIPTLTQKSNPQVKVIIEVKQDMETLNLNKGMVLRIASAGTQADTVLKNIGYYPSVPAPIAMYIDKNSDGDAYGFYMISRDLKGPVNAGNNLINWYGYCSDDKDKYAPRTKGSDDEFSCKGLSGEDIVDLQGMPDTIGTKVDVPLGEYKANAYGLHWDEESLLLTVDTTTVFFRGLVYLPPKESAKFKLISWSDTMKILSPSNAGTEFTLMPLNKDIGTVKQIYDLVDSNYMCITNPEGGAGVEFWWNPATVFDTMK